MDLLKRPYWWEPGFCLVEWVERGNPFIMEKTIKNDKIAKKAKRGFASSEIFFKKWEILTDSI